MEVLASAGTRDEFDVAFFRSVRAHGALIYG